MMGASLSTSSRLGIGKEDDFAYDIYELEFLPELLFGSTYRRSLTAVFPRFLCAMGKYHEEEIRSYFSDVFGFEGSIPESADRLMALFADFGIDLYFDGSITRGQVEAIPCETQLTADEVFNLVTSLLRK